MGEAPSVLRPRDTDRQPHPGYEFTISPASGDESAVEPSAGLDAHF